MKNIAMLLVAGCAIGMLTGCGIPEEEHNAIIASLKAEQQKEVETLNSDIADKESVIKSEKAKVGQSRIELRKAAARNDRLQKETAETAKALAAEKSKSSNLDSELKTSQSQAAIAQDQASDAESKYDTLEIEYQDLERRFEMFQQNMNSLSAPAPAAISTPEVASTPEDFGAPEDFGSLEDFGTPAESEELPPAQKATDLLDQMGTL
ncbi:MAG: hypothetical protein V5783_05655 [Pontiella sp.]